MKGFIALFVAALCFPAFAVSENISPADEKLLAEEFAQLESSAGDEESAGEAAGEALPWLVKTEAKIEEKVVDVVFSAGEVSINAENSLKLESVLNLLNGNSELKVILKSYSGKEKNHLSEDRRESLKRALAVRKYFTARGVDKTRISVKALGNSAVGDVKDKLEIFKL